MAQTGSYHLLTCMKLVSFAIFAMLTVILEQTTPGQVPGMLPPDFSYTPPPFQHAGLTNPTSPMPVPPEKEFGGGKGMPSLSPAIQPPGQQQQQQSEADWVQYETTQFSWDYGNEHIVGDKYKFQVVHRATNSMLKVYLEPGYPLHAKPGTHTTIFITIAITAKITNNKKAQWYPCPHQSTYAARYPSRA